MANVSFKRGLQANLPATGVEGAFYLTTDTNRLYVGKADHTLELLNQGVKVYDNWATIQKLGAELSVAGQIYYAQAENILCTYDVTNGKWIQINPDTNTDTTISRIIVEKNAQASDQDKLTYNIQVKEKVDGAEKDEAVSTTLVIDKADLNKLVTEVGVGISTSNSESDATLVLNGTGSNSNAKAQIKGDGTVQVSSSAPDDNGISVITITSNPYSLTTAENEGQGVINLKQSGTDVNTVNIKTSGSLAAKSDTGGNITVVHKNSGVSGSSYGAAAETKSGDPTITTLQIPSFDVNSEGHITNAGLTNINITDTHYKLNNISYDTANKAMSVTLQTSDGLTTSTVTTGTNTFYTNFKVLDKNATTSSIRQVFNQETTDFELYTAAAVDEKILKAQAAMDAMTFKGSMDGLPSEGTSNRGDTYKASEAFSMGTGLNAVNVKTNDLIIFNANDGEASNAPANWVVIPADTENTTYSFSTITNGFCLKGNDGAIPGELTTSGDLTISGSNGSYTIAHANSLTEVGTVGAEQKVDATARTFNIPSIAYDIHGHITNASDVTVTLPEDKDTTYTLKRGGDKEDSKISLWATGNEEVASVQIVGGTNIEVTNDNEHSNIINIAHESITTNAHSSESNVAFGGNITADKITVDNGHVTKVETTTYKLPSLPTFENSEVASLADNKLSINYDVKVDATTVGSPLAVGITSSSLTLTGTTDACSIDIVWETF